MAPLLGCCPAPNSPKQEDHGSQWGARHSGEHPRKNILYIDAYDSFSYNVVAMLEEVLDAQVTVLKIDSDWPDANISEFLKHYEAAVLGPGPGNPAIPQDVGIMKDIWNLHHTLPVLGICLGFQSLCLQYGVPITRLPHPLHGQVHQISTALPGIFENLQGINVTLYHSLFAEWDRPGNGACDSLELLAWLSIEDDALHTTRIPMAVQHREKPFWGVQFHPESCKSDRDACSKMLRRWWEAALAYNKRCARGGSHSLPLPNNTIHHGSDTASLPEIAFTILDWSAASSKISHFRTQTHSTTNLDAEMVCERLNTPGSPAVLFQTNGRYSIISMPGPTSWRLEYYAQTENLILEKITTPCDTVTQSLSVCELWDSLRYLMNMKKVESGDCEIPFWGGFLGYFSYEMGLACLARPKCHMDPLHPNPSAAASEDPADVSLLWTERSIVLDNKTGRLTIQSTREDDNLPTIGWLDSTLQFLDELSGSQSQAGVDDVEFLDSILRRGIIQLPNELAYLEQVEACKAELKAGESYELCLTCETSISLPLANSQNEHFPWELYKRLRKYNPAAFSAFARLGNVKIVSSSPECFLNWDRLSTLEMKPMKGTVKKSGDMTMKKAKAILSSTKEMAENLMIADLIRHDLYSICGSGGVHVEKLLEVEDHGRVYQMTTHVKGQVNPSGVAVQNTPKLQSPNMSEYGLTALQRCLPPGSMTGAPKERSCMHLRSIEDRKRGIYSGVMGFLDLGGGGSFSVLIRTAFSSSNDKEKQVWRIGAGGAVTILSTAKGEWEEMLTKLKTVQGIFTPLRPDGPVDSNGM